MSEQTNLDDWTTEEVRKVNDGLQVLVVVSGGEE